MPVWLSIAKGPIFRFVLFLFLIGALRLLSFAVLDLIASIRRAGNRKLPIPSIVKNTILWLIPLRRIHQAQRVYSYASIGMHLGIITTSFALVNHIEILRANIGIGWPAVPKFILDWAALIGIISTAYLLLHRVYYRGSRQLSNMTDYLLLCILLSIFVTGFAAGKQWNPIPYNGLMLLHTINGMILLVIIPYTKIAHCILFPFIRVGSEIAWHLVPRAGYLTVAKLHGPEGRKI